MVDNLLIAVYVFPMCMLTSFLVDEILLQGMWNGLLILESWRLMWKLRHLRNMNLHMWINVFLCIIIFFSPHSLIQVCLAFRLILYVHRIILLIFHDDFSLKTLKKSRDLKILNTFTKNSFFILICALYCFFVWDSVYFYSRDCFSFHSDMPMFNLFVNIFD